MNKIRTSVLYAMKMFFGNHSSSNGENDNEVIVKSNDKIYKLTIEEVSLEANK
jgi:hypothetical protein